MRVVPDLNSKLSFLPGYHLSINKIKFKLVEFLDFVVTDVIL